MGGLGTVVSRDEGPEIGPRFGEGRAEGGDKGCDFRGMVEFAELEGHCWEGWVLWGSG